MWTFHYAPETCALASHIAMLDCGAAFELRRVDFAKEEQRSPAFLEINPKGRVPALVAPEGVLTETPAMLIFIAQSHPEAKLAPADPFALAKVQEFNSFVASTLHVAHAHRMRGHRWADDEAAWEAMRRKVPQSVGDAYRLIEEGWPLSPFVTGETYTVADPYLFTVARWMEGDGVDPGDFPKIAAHRSMMAERETARRALADEA